MLTHVTSKIDDLTNKVQEKVQQSGIRETAGQTWRDVVERSRNVAHIGRAGVNESIEAAKRKYNQSIKDGAERLGEHHVWPKPADNVRRAERCARAAPTADLGG